MIMNLFALVGFSIVAATEWQQYTNCDLIAETSWKNAYGNDGSYFISSTYLENLEPQDFTKEECLTWAIEYQGYWSSWDKLHCVTYEVIGTEAKCFVYDKKSEEWPEEVRTCLLNNAEVAGENFYTILFQRAFGATTDEATYSEALGNCSPPSEEPGYVSTCDFGAANW